MLHRAAAVFAALAITLPVASLGAATKQAPLLNTAVITGSSVYSPADLFDSYRGQLGKPISRESAQAIITALQDLYLRDGYSRPEIALDDDSTASGILRAQIFEPTITRVVVSGDAGPHQQEVQSIASSLEHVRPVRRALVQDAVREMREMPGLTVTANTRKDPEVRNGFELTVDAAFQPVDGLVRLTNRGTEEIGPVFALTQVSANGLLGWQEKIGVLTGAATELDEYRGAGAFVDAPLPRIEETRAMLMGFRSYSNPTETGTDLDEEYLRDRLSLRVTRQLESATELHWSVYGGLELEDLEIEDELGKFRDDQLRIASLGTRVGWRSSANTQSNVTVDLLQGLDALGASLRADDLAVDDRDVDFTLLKLQFTRHLRFHERWSLRLDSFGQYARDVLPDSQRFKIGGDRLGRGFEVAEIAGDRGVGAKLELRRDLFADLPVLGRTSAYTFYDFGAAWKENVPGRESATTAGVGASMSGEHLTGYLEIATPITGVDIEGSDQASVFAEISYRF